MAFITDLSIPDGTTFNPGVAFTKSWRIKNTGTCTWTTGYSLFFSGGDVMPGTTSIAITRNVAPGQSIDLSANLVAPPRPGSYRSFWLMRNQAGKVFGTGEEGRQAIWVDIQVNESALKDTAYDFYANACLASWVSAAGSLPCPGKDGDAAGFILKLDNPSLEDGTNPGLPGLLTYPQNITDGYIQGIYPPFRVQAGDRFKAIVNCESSATACLVLFRLDYQVGNDPVRSLWAIGEVNDKKYFSLDLDISSLAGQDVKFILNVLAFGPATGDRAMWVAPRIVRP